ncbi:MAG TPA: hypothetical protein PKN23_15090, partial [Candidatus Hydrogenedentes bacterium]|nr:hypothetical protein [Candidatus Hydrogenedentota bacterium]
MPCAFLPAVFVLLAASAPGPEQTPRGVPTAGQLAWHALEQQMFLCLDPCTWQGREYDDHST